MTLVIYHGNCTDGFGAATATNYCKEFLGEIEYHKGFHGQNPPDVTGKDVFILDFSYKSDILKDMASKANSVTILDHHKSAQEDIQPLIDNGTIQGKFDMEHSGAYLAWEYFIEKYYNVDCWEKYVDENIVKIIKHIEDRDLWKFQYPRSKSVAAYIFSLEYDFDVWNDYVFNRTIDSMASHGEILSKKVHKDAKELIQRYMYKRNIFGYNVPVCNIPYMYASEAGSIMCKNNPFAVTYTISDDFVKLSFRSDEHGIDVSEVAKSFGGGGHENAAGASISLLTAKKVLL